MTGSGARGSGASRGKSALYPIRSARPALVGCDVRATHDEAGVVVCDIKLVGHHLPKCRSRALTTVRLPT